MTEAATPTLFEFECKVKDQILLKLAEFQECLLFFALLKFDHWFKVEIKIESKLIIWTNLLLFEQ